MTPSLLSIKRIFFQNDASTNPTLKFNYTVTNSSTPNVSSRLLVFKKNGNLWDMDNYALDATKTEYMLELENDKTYNFTLENTTPGSPATKEYGSISGFLLNINSDRSSLTEDETFFNSISVNVALPEGSSLSSIDYDLMFTVFDPSNNNNNGIVTFDVSKNVNNSYHFCNLRPNTDHFVTCNIKYTLNGIEYITKDSLDLETPIKTTNTYGTLSASIEADPSGTFGYYAGSNQLEQFNITWGINSSDVDEDCSSNDFVITYSLDKYVSSSTLDPTTTLSWISVLSDSSALLYNDTNPANGATPMQFVYYRIKAILVSTISSSGITWNSPYVYIGAPFLTKPVVPVLSVLHPDGDSADNDGDCIHVLVNGENDDQDTIQVQWNLVTGSTAKGGYIPSKFTYNSNDVLCDVDTGVLNVSITDPDLAKVNVLTVSDYSVTAPSTYDDLNLISSNNISAGDTYIVGNTSISFIPYKNLVISDFSLNDITPSLYNVTTCGVTLNCTNPMYGLTGVVTEYNWHAVKVDLEDNVTGTTFQVGVTTYVNTQTATVPSGDKYKFWVSVSQTFNEGNCQFTIATESSPMYKVAEKLAGTVPLTCEPDTPGLSTIPLDTSEVTSQPDYNTYTVTLDSGNVAYQDPTPVDQRTFQIQKSTASVWTDLAADVTTSSQVVNSSDNPITFTVRSSYVDPVTSTSYFGAVNNTSNVSYITPPVINIPTNLQLYSDNTDIGVNVDWDLTSNHATNVVSYVVSVGNGTTTTFYKHVNDDYINGVVNNTLNISAADLSSVSVSYGNYVTIYVTPYYKLNDKYYVGLTKQSPSILYRQTTPTVNLSLETPDDRNSSDVMDILNLYPTWSMGGNNLTRVTFEIQSRLATETTWSEYQVIDTTKLTDPNFSSVGTFTDFDSLKALLDTDITLYYYASNVTGLENGIKGKLLNYDLAGVYKNFQIKLTVSYSYTDENGDSQSTSIYDEIVVYNRNQPSDISAIRTGSATSSTKTLIITVKPNNSPLTDYVVLIGPDSTVSLNTAAKRLFVFSNLQYEYTSEEVVPVSALDENGFVTFTVSLNVYPGSAFLVISNAVGVGVFQIEEF